MTKTGSHLLVDFDLPAGTHVLTDRLNLIPGTVELSNAEQQNDQQRLSALLNADVSAAWPPEVIPDPASPNGEGWWDWYFLTREESGSRPRLIGIGGLKGWLEVTGTLQVGCSFLPEFQASGFGTEAVRGLTEWALSQPNVNQVVADIGVANRAAEQVVLNVGFTHTGVGADDDLRRYARSR